MEPTPNQRKNEWTKIEENRERTDLKEGQIMSQKASRNPQTYLKKKLQE